MDSQKKSNRLIIIVIITIIAIVLVGAVAGLQTGLFNLSVNNPTPAPNSSVTPTPILTQTPTITPTVSPTPIQTISPTTIATSTPSPTPSLPAPSLSVTVATSDYSETMGQYTTFICTVKINNAAYNERLSNFASSQSITVTDVMSSNLAKVTGNLATTLPVAFPQLHMNYGMSNNIAVSSAENGQFTITLHSESKAVVSLDNLSGAMTNQLNQIFTSQT
jgi:hypothetical protein